MKDILNYFLLIFLITGATSCNDDDQEIYLTNENGKPSRIKSYVDNITFHYEENRISQIIEEKGSTIKFEYTNNELISIYSRPTDKHVADRNILTTLKKENNKIIVKTTFDPFLNTSIHEIELDENNLPIKITDKGLYRHNQQLEDGTCYWTFLFDSETKNLLESKTFYIKNSQLIATRTYEYEDTPGIFSKVDLPLWFYAYINQVGFLLGTNIAYMNYFNNIFKTSYEPTEPSDKDKAGEISYNYKYNKDGFPISIYGFYANKKTIRIDY